MAALKPPLHETALRQVNHGRSSRSFQTILVLIAAILGGKMVKALPLPGGVPPGHRRNHAQAGSSTATRQSRSETREVGLDHRRPEIGGICAREL